MPSHEAARAIERELGHEPTGQMGTRPDAIGRGAIVTSLIW